MWCKNNSNGNSYKKKMCRFLKLVKFEAIPCKFLVNEIYPLGIVPSYTIIRALAIQANSKLTGFPSQEEMTLSPVPEAYPKSKV